MQPQNAAQECGASAAEAYGFVGWVTSTAAYVVFLFWAYLPEQYLEDWGITWYPRKYWALAIPTYICVSVIFVYWLYESLNMMSTPSADSLTTFTDKHARDKPTRPDPGSTPPMYDIPITRMSEVLYGRRGGSELASPAEAQSSDQPRNLRVRRVG
mmetsp:Transcript_14213/g.30424  ORF Transcript_14213/g.30424 Transcript_14213/m.30424 type:complete len:156 (-) Transcript_14213:164-631(-)